MRQFLTLFILLSLFLHLSGYWGTYSIQPYKLNLNNNKNRIEVSMIETDPEKNETQTHPVPLRFAEAPKELIDDSLEQLKKKVDILSEKVQRVKKETKAQLFGLTKNRWNQPSSTGNNHQSPSAESSSRTHKKDTDPQSSDSINQIHNSDLTRNSNNSLPHSNPLDAGASTFGNDLKKKVELGQFTALNTDRHLYYSFYSRIEEMIRPPWEEDVTREAKLIRTANLLRPQGGWSTRLDVILNPTGKLIRVSLLKGSGVKGFDEAAISAFEKADFFPHPPKGIVNEEGLIVLKYLFTVY